VTIGGHAIQNLFAQRALSERAIIGSGLLRHFSLTIDQRNQLVRFTPVREEATDIQGAGPDQE
jgi:hypothetical protein